MNKTTKNILRKLIWIARLAGRRNLYRTSQLLMRAARGDVKNKYKYNGEKMVQTVALRASVPPATILDVGANVGDWTAGLLEIAGKLHRTAHVHVFEPCKGTFSRLSERYANSPDVTLVNQACSGSAGTAAMYVYGSGDGTNSLAEPIDDRVAAREEVQLTTIDLYCKAAGIEKIDLLKIDAEGYDFEVISGASEMLNGSAIRFIQFEYNHRWIGAHRFLKDVFSFLIPKGYAIGKLTGSRVEFYPFWKWELETWDEGNYIVCSRQDMSQFDRSEPSWLLFERNSQPGPAA